jgi:hypothetical protein
MLRDKPLHRCWLWYPLQCTYHGWRFSRDGRCVDIPALGDAAQIPQRAALRRPDDLRERLAAGGFVLLAGDSAAGKSRAAFEAMTATLPGHLLTCPASRDAVTAAVARAAQARRCVLWLDDLCQGTPGLPCGRTADLPVGGQVMSL